jgi:serine/threonine-protein kinase
LAWARLARADAYLYWLRADRSAGQLSKVEQESRRAAALAPGLPEAHIALGYFHYWGRADYPRALEEFSVVQATQPNNAEVAGAIGLVLRRGGRWEEAAASLRRAAELDPLSYVDLSDLGETYLALRDYARAEQTLLRATAAGPDLPLAYARLMQLYLNWHGSLDESRQVLGRALARMDLGRLVGGGSGRSFQSLIVADTAHRTAVASLTPASFDDDTLGYFTFKANLFRYLHEPAVARAYEDSTSSVALRVIGRHDDDVFTHATLAVMNARSGHIKDAIAEGKRAVMMAPLSVDALSGQAGPVALAEVYTLAGDPAAAVNLLEELLSRPSFLSGPRLLADPTWTPLRGNQRFDRLVTVR